MTATRKQAAEQRQKAAETEHVETHAEALAMLKITVRVVRADYECALGDVRSNLGWLADYAREAERAPDAPSTPGNMASVCAKIESARYKAKALREVLDALDARVREFEGASP